MRYLSKEVKLKLKHQRFLDLHVIVMYSLILTKIKVLKIVKKMTFLFNTGVSVHIEQFFNILKI